MKQVIPFSKYFVPTAIFSFILVVLGIVGYFSMGFNLGIDFQAGLLQEIQFAPTAFGIRYNGPGNAVISLSRTSLDIIVSGIGVEEDSHRFPFSSHATLGDLSRALRGVEGLTVSEDAPSNISTSWLIQSAQSSPRLEADIPFTVHYLRPDASPIRIEDVRTSLLPLGSVSVQVLCAPAERHFMIRMEDAEISGERSVPADRVIAALERSFGEGEVAVVRSDYVGSRFAKQLSDQAGGLVVMTLLIILAYCTFRFKLQYATGAVVAIIHNGLIMIAFIVWSRMEFNTITIAAILTILGYSINDVIVVFDRMKETRRIYPDDTFVNVLDRAVSETLSRTVITTLTTMLAVAFLYVFTSGSMKDFAAALLVGLVSGVYSTIFIAMNFVYFWEIQAQKKANKKLGIIHARVPAK